MFTPLFADNFQNVVSLIVIVMGAIGWIINVISNQNQPKTPPPRKKPREEREPEEISMFLDASPPRPAKQPQKQNRKPQNQPQQQKPARRENLQEQNRREASTRPGQEMSQREMHGSNLGGGIRSRGSELEQKVSQDIGANVVKPTVASSVSQHLGTFAAGEAAARKASGESTEAAKVIADALRDPASIRQAILVNTLLSRPPGLRKR